MPALPLRRFFTLLLACTVAILAACAVYNTTFNNAYYYGATVWDSTEFATAIWRSGWTLKLAPVFGENVSFFTFHSSPIQYIPNLISYVFPGDRITFYALVYAILYAALMASVFYVLAANMPGWLGAIMAAMGAGVFFCSQVMVGGSWEMRIDYASPLFAILAFRAWQLRRYRQAALCLVLNACVREDIGIIFAIPLCLLAGVQWLSLRASDPALARERLTRGVMLTFVSVGAAALSWTAQVNVFDVFDQINSSYYTLNDPFGHLTEEIIHHRASHIFYHMPGLWLPLACLAVVAIPFRDMRLMVGAVAFIPYLMAMFFSKTDISGMLLSYKPFPLTLCLVWPALIALEKPAALKRRYMILQLAVLACGMAYFSEGHARALYYRWTPRPMTENAHLYRQFGEKVLDKENPFSGRLRASHGIIALYPYQFPVWWDSNIDTMKEGDEDTVDTIIWFDGDRDRRKVQILLERGRYAKSIVPGTQIMIARRLPADADMPDPREFSIEPLP